MNPFEMGSSLYQAWEDGYHKRLLTTPQVIPLIDAYLGGSRARFEEEAALLRSLVVTT